MAAGRPPTIVLYVTGFDAIPGIAIYHHHTILLSSTVHQPLMPLFRPRLLQGTPQLSLRVYPVSSDSRFLHTRISTLVYMNPPHQSRLYRLNRSFLFSKIHIFPFTLFFTSAETHANAHTAPRSPFGTLGSLFSGLEPVHMSVPSVAKVRDYRLSRSDDMSAQVSGN